MASGIKALSVAMYRQIFPPQIHPIGWFMGDCINNSATTRKQILQAILPKSWNTKNKAQAKLFLKN